MKLNKGIWFYFPCDGQVWVKATNVQQHDVISCSASSPQRPRTQNYSHDEIAFTALLLNLRNLHFLMSVKLTLTNYLCPVVSPWIRRSRCRCLYIIGQLILLYFLSHKILLLTIKNITKKKLAKSIQPRLFYAWYSAQG